MVAAIAGLGLVGCGTSAQEGGGPKPAAAHNSQPVAPVRPVTDVYFGIPVVDRYRYMENLDDPEVQAWMRGQADYTRGVLDRIPGRAKMLEQVKKYVDAPPATVSDLRRMAGGKYFFLKTLANQSIAKLYMRQGVDGQDELLVDTDHFTGPHGEPPAINYFQPSDDGRYVAFGVSQGGSEMATLYVFDVENRKQLPDAIDRTEFGGVGWRADNKSFFYNRLQKLGPQSSPLDKYRDNKAYLHVLGQPADQDPVILGRGVVSSIPIEPDDEVYVITQPGSPYAIGAIVHGVKLEETLYVAPVASLGTVKQDAGANSPWAKVCDVDADVTDFAFNADDIYLLSHHDAPRFKIVRTPLAHPTPPEQFEAVLPQTEGVLKGMTVAADALYARELDGGIYHVMRIAPGAAAEKVPLPFEGNAEVDPADPRVAGITMTLTSWVKGPRIEEYDPKTNKVNLTTLRPPGPFDNPDDLVSLEVESPSYDGTLVPLSIMMKKGTPLDGTAPTILGGYGAYGMTEDPGFSNSRLAWLEHGGIDAIAHVRGGGERGEPWHLAGYKLTKPNTWRDMIACAQYLIDHHYTSSAHLGIVGGSAGGITIGRSITERPDLFAAAVPMVGALNTVRSENSPNGPPNIPEFGSTATQPGFEDLFAMDSYHHVRDGVAYPAVMLTTGLNDPRVASWEPAKMTARLQAANSGGKPILLRIDYQGGHGIGATKQQRLEETADLYSFFLWQFGDPAFQPPSR